MGKLIKRAFALICVLAIAAILNGILRPLHEHFAVTLADLPPQELTRDPDRPFVGLSLSGGGARAAAFSAGGIEALAKYVPLETITHVSSVSGGGFTASYMATVPYVGCSPEYEKSACEAYFDRLRAVASPPSMWGIEKFQLTDPRRILSPSRRLNSLQQVMNQADFLSGKTFSELDPNKTWYFNAVSYDNGRPFVFSNGTLPAAGSPETQGVPLAIRSETFSDAHNLRAAPPDMPISLAVATSAAFPPYLGPTTLTIDGGQEYWHLGDGGIVENTGIATLREALHARGGNEKATIYSFDAGQRLDINASLKTLDLSIWTTQITRTVDILNEYAGGFRGELFDALDTQKGIKLDIITFDYQDVGKILGDPTRTVPGDLRKRWTDWAWWMAEHNCAARDDKPAQALIEIPTRLSIADCNKGLISEAAKFLVIMHFEYPPPDPEL